MIVLFVLLTFVILVLLYFFFAPFYIEINSAEGLYRLRFHRLYSIAVKLQDDPIIETNILGWKQESSFFTKAFDRKASKDNTKSETKRPFPLKKLIRVVSSFKVNKFYMNLDSGDMQLNGMLYPVFAWISWYSRKNVQVNFTGRNILILEIENSLARMSRAWLGSYK